MSVNTNKNILITSGLGKTSESSVSQIDFKWSESGVGTGVFAPHANDIRSTIYNWQDNNEPVLLLGGAGSVNGVQNFVGPYTDYSGIFSGITNSPTIKLYPLTGKLFSNNLSISSSAIFYQGINFSSITQTNIDSLTQYGQGFVGSYFTNLSSWNGNGFAFNNSTDGSKTLGLVVNADEFFFGSVQDSDVFLELSATDAYLYTNLHLGYSLYDVNNYPGNQNDVLVSLGTSVIWQTPSQAGIVTAAGSVNYYAKFNSPTSLAIGIISDNGQFVTVAGGINVSGYSTSVGFYGPGTNITNLQSANLVGIIPSNLLSGTYSGITSVGTLTRLNVSGITTSGYFFGDGSNLTNLNASNLSSGTVPNGRLTGTYSGITSVGTLTQLNVSGITTLNAVYVSGRLFDANNTNGSSGQILSSLGSGIAWSTPVQIGLLTGTASANQIAVWNNAKQLTGYNTFVYTGIGSVGIGTATPSASLHIYGNVRITGGIYDSNNNIGLANSVLSSTGNGLAWTAMSGGINGSIAANQIAYGSASNTIQGSNNLWFNGSNLGIGTSSPAYTLSVQGNANVTGVASASSIFATTITVTNETISNQLTINAAAGVQPIVINSFNTTKVPNLNAGYWADNAYPLTTIGDMMYGAGIGGSTLIRVPPNSTTTTLYLAQSGDGSTAGAPSWQPLPISGLAYYYLGTSPADISPDKYMTVTLPPTGIVTSVVDNGSNGIYVGIATFITPANYPNLLTIPQGIIDLALFATGTNSGSKYTQLSAKVYEYGSTGISTLIATLSQTTNLSATITQYNLTASLASIYSLSNISSRIRVDVLQYQAQAYSATVQLYCDGSNPSAFSFPAPAANISNFVPYSGATQSVNLGNFNLISNSLILNSSPSGVNTSVAGTIFYDASQNQTALTFPYNQEVVHIGEDAVVQVFNDSGSVLGVGSVVYIYGSSGVNTSIPTVRLANSSFSTSASAIGLVGNSIGMSSYGYVHVQGSTQANTSNFTAGDALYLSTTNGILTNISPTRPQFAVQAGFALDSKPNGTVLVNISSKRRNNLLNEISYTASDGYPTGSSTFIYDGTNLGVGTASPQAKVHNTGTERIDSTLILNSNISDTKNQRVFIGANTSTTSLSFIGISSIFVPSGYSLTIEGKANGFFSNALNESGKFFAAFYNSGTLTQVGASDVVSKYNGVFGNFDVQGIGSYVTVVVKSDPSGNSWYWRVGYDYLLTQNA